MKNPISHISGEEIDHIHACRADELREPLFLLIKKDFPDFNKDSYISFNELNKYRKQYLSSLIFEELGEVSQLDHEVMFAMTNNKILSENIEDKLDGNLTIGQKIADNIASFGGSWTFIISFFLFLFIWMIINIWVLAAQPFDPYPFILLNLILSCIAAIQAPVIMMSQNRKEEKDRQRGEHDYKINLRAELEIKLLHEKIDHLIIHQNKRLLDIQELQTDYLEDIMKEIRSSGKNT